MTTKLYIYGPKDGGEGPYCLMTADGEVLYSHFCSGIRWAPGDLIERLSESRAARRAACEARFGEYVVVLAGGSELSHEELLRRNKAWAEAEDITGEVSP